ncbi:MAG: IS110 family transposase [Gaiella sp.]
MARLPEELRHVHLNAAGIDIGAGSHYVAIPQGRDPEGCDVREFGAFTADLYALAEWLRRCGIETVAMESTGVYWIPLFELLAERGLEVRLVDPRQLKNVPGRKSDVLDCQWIQQLHTFGLLSAAFRPDDQICVLRSYLRQRAMLVSYASHHIQHVQKALEQMNLKLTRVVSDVTGVTGMRIIRAILDGQRDPRALAGLRDRRCQHDEATIARALEGNWRLEHLFALRQAVELLDFYQQQIVACDREIEAYLGQLDAKNGGSPLPARPRTSKPSRTTPTFDVRNHLYRLTGVDLTRIDGIDAHTALKVVAEIGVDMSRWPTEGHFASWLSLAPGTKVSGGKKLSGRTKPSASRAAAALRLAARSLYHSKSALGAFFRRLKARLGAPKAITATAHKLARLIYRMIKFGTEYVDRGQEYYDRRYRTRVVSTLMRRAEELGYSLVRKEDPSPVPSPT